MIRVYEPIFTEADAQAVYRVVKGGILSSFGEEVKRLESTMAAYFGVKHAISCSSGSAALHLSMMALGVKQGEYVVCPNGCYAAVGSSICHVGGIPWFIDTDLKTWNMDLDKLAEDEDNWMHPRAIVAVHNYGNPLDMDRLKEIYPTIPIIEDACEAFSATYKSQKIGSLGTIGLFSFYGNKLIAGGEGGLLLTNDDQLAERLKLLKGQGQDPSRRFWHLIPGFNYRMTNMQAAVINSQFDRLMEIQGRKLEIARHYRTRLGDFLWQEVPEEAEHSYWMVSVAKDEPKFFERASKKLAEHEIESRPIFYPMSMMPAFHTAEPVQYENAQKLSEIGISLPSGPGTTPDQIDHVCDILEKV